MVRVKTSSGILRPRERLPLRNLLGGKILPRAVPDISATRHSTSLILRSPIHSSNFACDMINQWLWREYSLAGLWLTAQTGLATSAHMTRSTDAPSYYQATAQPFPAQPALKG